MSLLGFRFKEHTFHPYCSTLGGEIEGDVKNDSVYGANSATHAIFNSNSLYTLEFNKISDPHKKSCL